MDGKWMYHTGNSDIWNDSNEFDTMEEAIRAGKEEVLAENKLNEENGNPFRYTFFRVGRIVAVTPSGIDVDWLLENVAENTVQGMEVGEDYLCDVEKEHSDELEKKLNEVLFTWMDEHNYYPSFYKIENEKEVYV